MLGCLQGTFSCRTDLGCPQPALTGSCKTVFIPVPQITCTGIEENPAPPFTGQDLKEEAFSVAGYLEMFLNCMFKKKKKFTKPTLALSDARRCHRQTSNHHRHRIPKGPKLRRLGHHPGQDITVFHYLFLWMSPGPLGLPRPVSSRWRSSWFMGKGKCKHSTGWHADWTVHILEAPLPPPTSPASASLLFLTCYFWKLDDSPSWWSQV